MGLLGSFDTGVRSGIDIGVGPTPDSGRERMNVS